jgi:DNA-binding MarR family transcriptional regulator
MYEEELRETGLRATQLTLMQALEIAGPIKQGELGDILSIDSTTLTRSLRPLIDAGWVKSERGRDRRERIFSLSAAGEKKVHASAAAWRRAQSRFKKAFGPGWDQVEEALGHIADSL